MRRVNAPTFAAYETHYRCMELHRSAGFYDGNDEMRLFRLYAISVFIKHTGFESVPCAQFQNSVHNSVDTGSHPSVKSHALMG